MTQLTAAFLQSSGKKSFILEVYDRQGRALIKRYTSDSPGGLIEGFTLRRYPNGTCGQLDFEAKPNLMVIEPGSITRLYFDTGTAVVPIHYGVVTSSPDPRSGGRGVYEVASGKELLKRSVCGETALETSPLLRDAAHLLRTFVADYVHDALGYRPEKIPFTGVLIGSVDARLTNLYEAIEAILQAVPNIKENDWGVDAEGHVVIRPPSGVVNLSYNEIQGQFGNIDSSGVVTRATIRVANAVSDGAIVSAGYRASVIAHTYTHPEHVSWQAPRVFDLPTNSEGLPVIDPLEFISFASIAPHTYGSTSWQSSVANKTVSEILVDGDSTTYAYPGSNNPGDISFASHSSSIDFVGATVILDAADGAYGLSLRLEYSSYDGTTETIKHTISFNLNDLIGQGKSSLRVIAPKPPDPTVNALRIRLRFAGTVSTSVKVYEIRSLRANTTLLNQIAQSNIRLPAREVTQVTCARSFTADGQAIGGFLLVNLGKTLRINDGPEPIEGEIAEIVDTFTTTEGMLSRISTGNPLRAPEVRAFMQLMERR